MDDLYKQAVDLQNRFRNYIDQPNSQAGRSLDSEIQRLEDDIQTKKNKGSLEVRVVGIVRILDSLRDDSVMDYGDINDLKNRLEDMRAKIRRL